MSLQFPPDDSRNNRSKAHEANLRFESVALRGSLRTWRASEFERAEDQESRSELTSRRWRIPRGRVLRFHLNEEALARLSGYSAQQARFNPDAYRSTHQHVKLSARLPVCVLVYSTSTVPLVELLCSCTSRSEFGCFTAKGT